MNLIVAVDNNWAIGKDNDLLFHIKEDMKNFMAKTMGGTVIMGRKTLESMPKGEPLKGRINIVLTKNGLKTTPKTTLGGAEDRRALLVCNSFEDCEKALNMLCQSVEDDDVWVIGGANIYTQLLDKCQKAYVTKVLETVTDADKFIPNLDKLDSLKLTFESETFESMDGKKYLFTIYEKIS